MKIGKGLYDAIMELVARASERDAEFVYWYLMAGARQREKGEDSE